MSASSTAGIRRAARLPLLMLLDPREYTPAVVTALAIGVVLGAIGMRWFDLPLWGATTIVLGVLLVPGALKWRSDAGRFGRTVMILGILLAAQGFHSVEHATQWLQNHVLGWPARESTGLLSAANAEWVHFAWNWTVLIVVAYLFCKGMRGPWGWLLLAWSLAHTIEHTYMFVRYLQVLEELRQMGITTITAQGLPGIFGRDGWLAQSDATRDTFLCRLPGLTTAPRLDVHFWWNNGETTLLLLAANAFLLGRVRPAGAAPSPLSQRS